MQNYFSKTLLFNKLKCSDAKSKSNSTQTSTICWPRKVRLIRCSDLVFASSGRFQQTELAKRPFLKQLSGTVALMILGVSFTKRYFTFPHYHKDQSKPMYLSNGELHPMENQPAVSVISANLTSSSIERGSHTSIRQAPGTSVNVMISKTTTLATEANSIFNHFFF